MSLASLELDDLRWAGMVEAIRSRIAANSDGEWTMHGPLDPGVTLLELFAYQFEQRIYWLNQLSEPLQRSLLALLDDAPRTTEPARTVLAFRNLEHAHPLLVPAWTVFHPRNRDLPLRLTTLEDAVVLPISHESDRPRIDVTASGEDRSADLRAGRTIPLMPADRSAGQLTLVLWLQRELKSDELEKRFSLYLDLHTSEKVLPEWAAVPEEERWFDRATQAGYDRTARKDGDLLGDHCRLTSAELGAGLAGPAPDPSSTPPIWINDFVADEWSREHLLAEPPAQLIWRYSTGPSSRAEFAEGQLLDGTGGLRRPGLVRIEIPPNWKPVATSASGEKGYALYLSCDSCTWSAPPRLRRMLPNTAVAQEVRQVVLDWESLESQVDRWTLRLPGQELRLDPNHPGPLEESMCLELLERGGPDGGWHDWHATDDFYHHDPADRVFVVDRPRKRLLFGNGLNGRIPVLHRGTQPSVKLRYLVGSGAAGNIGKLEWVSRDAAIDVRTENPVQAQDGASAESLAEARARVGRSLSQRERAITEEDFQWLAENTPGVAIARAHAAVGFHPCFPCHPVNGAVTVFLVPDVPRDDHLFESGQVVRAPITDPGALAEVTRRLDTRRLLTAEVYVRTPRYRPVRLRVTLQGIVAGEDRLKADLEQHLTRHLDPLVGGESHEGWPFGESLRPSGLIKQIQEKVDAGVAVKRVGIALDREGSFEDCHDVKIGPHELVYLEDLTLTLERNPTTGGGLR